MTPARWAQVLKTVSQAPANLHRQVPAGPHTHQPSEMGLDTLRQHFRLQKGLSSALSPWDSGITSASPRKGMEQWPKSLFPKATHLHVAKISFYLARNPGKDRQLRKAKRIEMGSKCSVISGPR